MHNFALKQYYGCMMSVRGLVDSSFSFPFSNYMVFFCQ